MELGHIIKEEEYRKVCYIIAAYRLLIEQISTAPTFDTTFSNESFNDDIDAEYEELQLSIDNGI